MKIDTSPGSLDGPPAEPRLPLATRLGVLFAAAVTVSAGALLIVAMWWAITWLLTNLPT